MRFLTLSFCVLAISVSVAAQRTTRPTPTPTPVTPEIRYTEIAAVSDARARLDLLSAFAEKLGDVPLKRRAQELISSTRAEIADTSLREGKRDEAIDLFLAAIAGAPEPVSDQLFAKVLLQIPTNLYAVGDRDGAFKSAEALEVKISADARKLIGLSTFYITIQYGTGAIKLAEKAIDADPEFALAKLTLATALRLNFRFDDAIAVYKKILESNPSSLGAKRELADLTRAAGDYAEAIKLYEQVLEADKEDSIALAGLAIALTRVKEDDLSKEVLESAIKADPDNAQLFSSIAMHHLSKGDAIKAMEFSDKAIAAAPTFVWGYLVKAKAMRKERNLYQAERLLNLARSLGDFPSIDYEIASLRYASGLYREAAEILIRSYDLDGDLIVSYLGNRILADSPDFASLLRLERRAATLDSMIVSESDTDRRLKALLGFVKGIIQTEPDDSAVVSAAKNFIDGDDEMRIHREIFVVSRMMDRNIAVDDAMTIIRGAFGSVEKSLESDAVVTATLADDLYPARSVAFARGEMILTPTVPKQVLSTILRGRIEELIGLGFFLKEDTAQAIIRFRRALSVLPEKSFWWRSTNWRLGEALEKDGKAGDALEAYVKSYDRDNPEFAKYLAVEKLWESVKGSRKGLEDQLGPRPLDPNARIADDETPKREESSDDVSEETPLETKSVERPRPILAEDVPFVSPQKLPVATVENTKDDSVTDKQTEKKEEVRVESDQKSIEEIRPRENQNSEKQEEVKKLDETSSVSKPAEPVRDSNQLESVVIAPKKTETAVASGEVKPCRLVPSVSLATVDIKEGSLKVNVLSLGGDHREIEAASLDTANLSVESVESDDDFRKMFVIRSTGNQAGVFKILFKSPCGTRELDVRVK